MKKQPQNWRKIACPKCGVPAGANCFRPPGQMYATACAARRQEAKRIYGIHIPSGTDLVRYASRTEWASACKDGKHEPICTGRRRLNHGVAGKCKCPCHRAKVVTKVTLSESASMGYDSDIKGGAECEIVTVPPSRS